MFHKIQHMGIKTKGHNWASMHIQLEKDQELIVVTSYTKHGWDVEALHTFEQVQEYLGVFDIPWVPGRRL